MLESLSTTELAQYPTFGHKDAVSSSTYAIQLTPGSLSSKPSQPNLTKDKSHAVNGSLSDENSKKRKRDASPSPEPDKRACHSTGVSTDFSRLLATHNDRPSPAPRNGRASSSQPQRVNRCDPIPRLCTAPVSTADSSTFVSSYDIVKANMSHFKAYFFNTHDPCDQSFIPEYLPYIDLEYPMTGMSERFALLAPRDKEAWHPIVELMEVVGYIVKFYLPESHATVLGDIDQCTYTNGRYRQYLNRFKPRVSTISSKIIDGTVPTSRPIKPESPLAKNLLVRMERAYNRRDGIAFMAAIKDINLKLLTLKKGAEGNILLETVKSWHGVPFELVNQIYEETYQRSAGPQVKELTKQKSGKGTKSETYGELNIGFIAELCQRSGLKPGVNFLDLGSGIGNVVVQAALLAGCKSDGVEKLERTATIADGLHQVFKERCQLWGVHTGHTDVFEGDFTTHTDKLHSIIQNADVVLANNFVFSPELNEDLKQVFLDLKDGAKIISLKPFGVGQVTDRNIGSIEAILDVEIFEWQSGDVSWADATGKYYISTVNRARLKQSYEAVYTEAQGAGRASRRRK